MSSDVAIRVDRVSKNFQIYEKPEHRLMELVSFGRITRHREFAALKDVSLEVRRGETVGIVGRNGCGKSTLLQVICGILQPSAGTVETRGRIAALLELGAGFDGAFSGRENVYLNGAIHGRTRAEMDERFEAIATFADIGEFIERPVKTYSSGMFVRLAFATAVNVDPAILVVDEALAVGDEAFQRKCFARIEQIRDRGATILFVSHSAQTIIHLCDRAVLMDAGEKLMEGRPKEVVANYQRLANAPRIRQAGIRIAVASGRAEKTLEGQTDPVQSKAGLEQDSELHLEDNSLELDSTLLGHVPPPQEDNGATASDICIATLSGRRVNVLQRGRRYRIRATVGLRVPVETVQFGFMLRTIMGALLGGAFTPKARLADFHEGATRSLKVEFELACRLLPGAYAINFNAIAAIAGEEVTVCRSVDAMLFRVAPEPDTLARGIVEFDARGDVLTMEEFGA